MDEYNAQMKYEAENIRDFIVLHYHVTQREDSKFWRHCKYMPIPESLTHKLALFKETGKIYTKTGELFADSSWLQVMTGQGLMPEHYNATVNQMSDDELANFLRSVREPIKKTVTQMPSHQQYLDYYCKASSWE